MEMLFNGGAPQAGAATDKTVVKDGTTATFVADVIEASATVPVIVDFWATWCGPCKTLGPLLERLVREAKGKVRLVKIDVDKNQQLAAQLRIQTVPTVYAFKDGRPFDGFNGAVPESQLREFVARLTGGLDPLAEIDSALAEAAACLAEGDSDTAIEIYREVIAHDPENGAAVGGLLRALIAAGRRDEAKHWLDKLAPALAAHPDIAAQQAAIELAEEAERLAPAAQLMRRVAENPDDHQARFDLALAEFGAGKQAEALDLLLELFRRDRAWNDGGARKQLIKLFEVLGPTDPLTVAARKRLSSLMFS